MNAPATSSFLRTGRLEEIAVAELYICVVESCERIAQKYY
jgi:hypothetical protein